MHKVLPAVVLLVVALTTVEVSSLSIRRARQAGQTPNDSTSPKSSPRSTDQTTAAAVHVNVTGTADVIPIQNTPQPSTPQNTSQATPSQNVTRPPGKASTAEQSIQLSMLPPPGAVVRSACESLSVHCCMQPSDSRYELRLLKADNSAQNIDLLESQFPNVSSPGPFCIQHTFSQLRIQDSGEIACMLLLTNTRVDSKSIVLTVNGDAKTCPTPSSVPAAPGEVTIMSGAAVPVAVHTDTNATADSTTRSVTTQQSASSLEGHVTLSMEPYPGPINVSACTPLVIRCCMQPTDTKYDLRVYKSEGDSFILLDLQQPQTSIPNIFCVSHSISAVAASHSVGEYVCLLVTDSTMVERKAASIRLTGDTTAVCPTPAANASNGLNDASWTALPPTSNNVTQGQLLPGQQGASSTLSVAAPTASGPPVAAAAASDPFSANKTSTNGTLGQWDPTAVGSPPLTTAPPGNGSANSTAAAGLPIVTSQSPGAAGQNSITSTTISPKTTTINQKASNTTNSRGQGRNQKEKNVSSQKPTKQ